MVGDGYVCGRTSNMFWNLAADQSKLQYSYLQSNNPAGSPNPPELVVGACEDNVRWILSLGILQLKFGTLRWLDKRSFSAEANWDLGAIHGSIVEFDDGIPMKLQFTVERITNVIQTVYYSYAPGAAFPPKTVVRVVSRNGVQEHIETNVIQELVIGKIENFKGFSPSYFQTSDLDPKTVFVTNGDTFFVRPDGTFQLLSSVRPDLSSLLPHQPSKWPRIVLIALVFSVISVLCWKVAKRRMHRQPPICPP